MGTQLPITAFILLLLSAPSFGAGNSNIPPNPDHPEEFFETQNLSEFIVVDELQYPVPKNIDRRPGLPAHVESSAALGPPSDHSTGRRQ